MPVIVSSESKTRETTPYTMASVDEALDAFFDGGREFFRDVDGEEPVSREEVLFLFLEERQVVFFDDEGDKTLITQTRRV
jgi:hypothetical protein